MTAVDVVVCVGGREEPLADCLAALERQGAAARVVRERTRWRARQAALAQLTADVIAFVDADVVVPDGWLARLQAAWEAAPPSIAAIGGPIGPRGGAPGWMHGTLGLVDYGDQAADVDPQVRTLFAGNLSFARRPLVGAGGFGAPLGGGDARDWQSEEHEAQRQLGHWGWLVRYDPSLRAERVVATRGAMRRRLRYGVRTGLAGARSRGSAFRQMLASVAGVAAALARGSRALAAERLGRAAENAGVVASAALRAPALADRSAPLQIASPRAAGDVAVVVLYHRIAEGEPDPLGLCVAPGRFEQQLEVLRSELDVVPISELARRVAGGEPIGGLAAITFDDGYADNLEVAAPIIEAARVPVTLFAATEHISTGERFFWDEAWRLICGGGARPKRLELAGDGVAGAWQTKTPDQRAAAFRALHRLIQPRPAETIRTVLRELRDWAGEAAPPPPGSTRLMTIDELRRFAALDGVELGAHTRSHVNLAHQPDDVVRAEVAGSRADLVDWLGVAPAGFSYPFGLLRHDVSERARAEVAAAGFGYAVVNQPVAVEPVSDLYALPRLPAPDAAADSFRAWLARARS
ncbi:MAG: polysaccharide deacetylase family protein [Thermoleophilaceae bacterium]